VAVVEATDAPSVTVITAVVGNAGAPPSLAARVIVIVFPDTTAVTDAF